MRQEKLGEILVRAGVLSNEQVQKAIAVQQKTGERIGQILIKQGFISSERLARTLAEQQGLEFVDISGIKFSGEILSLIPADLCKKYKVVPLSSDGFLIRLALSDPMNFVVIDDLRVFLSKDIQAVVADSDAIDKVINSYCNQTNRSDAENKSLQDKADLKSDVDVGILEALKAEGEEIGKDDAPVIKLVSHIIVDAFNKRASDIHVEPMKDRVRVRYRIDGMLQEVQGPTKTLQGAVLSRLKIMSKLDIAEKRLPQDGRIKLSLFGRDVDVRVSTLPSLYGESVVLRLLDREKLLVDLDDLGFSEQDERVFSKMINIPNGIVLVTGPTGSGKTTTLYTSLNSINTPNRKIITVEDPVEYQLSGINQVQIKPAIGLTFASGLRAILRQAPNVIMIGEIRDLETASIAIESSLTGHLVFSTLHTNDAAGAITRLVDMGIKAYLVASSVRAILAQRLVKKICPHCKEKIVPKQELIEFLNIKEEEIASVDFFKGLGCKECSQTGYLGRVAVFELLVLNDDICELVYKKVSSNIIRERARQCGMRTLREDALYKAFKGVTTLEEVIRVTQSDLE